MADNHGHKIAFSSASRRKGKGEIHMSSITVKDGTRIYYKDWGKGPAVTFSQACRLSSNPWHAQMLFFAKNELPRFLQHRRGPGRTPTTSPGHADTGNTDT